MLFSSVEKPLTNDVDTPDDAQEEVQHPNIEQKDDDDVQQERSSRLPTPRQKRKSVAPRSYIEKCNHVVYALNLASEVEGVNESSTYIEARPQMTQVSG